MMQKMMVQHSISESEMHNETGISSGRASCSVRLSSCLSSVFHGLSSLDPPLPGCPPVRECRRCSFLPSDESWDDPV